MLFVVMLGGKHPRAKIEVHDVQFVVADSLEAAYPQLREGWFGSPAGLHIDSWMRVDGIEDYRLELSALAPAADAPRLYFINLGGYEAATFGEATVTCWWWPGTRRRPRPKASSRCLPTGTNPTPMPCWTSTTACPSTWRTAATCTW